MKQTARTTEVTDNRHELAMVQQCLGVIKRSRAKKPNRYKFYAEEASFWLKKAQEKNDG